MMPAISAIGPGTGSGSSRVGESSSADSGGTSSSMVSASMVSDQVDETAAITAMAVNVRAAGPGAPRSATRGTISASGSAISSGR